MTDSVLLHFHQVQTRDGSICLYGKDGVLFSNDKRPVLLLVHGAFRDSSVLFQWINLFGTECDVVFADLPGHGRSPATTTATVESFAENIGDAITAALSGRSIVVLGESLGGLIAIALGRLHLSPLKGIVAADPPLTMAKLWHVRRFLIDALANDPANQFLQSFALNIFGVDADGNSHERIYYDLIEQVSVPIHIITGDVPLLPIRNVASVPCLIDDVDRYVVRRLFGDALQLAIVTDCGHHVLIDGEEECRKIVGRFSDSVWLAQDND